MYTAVDECGNTDSLEQFISVIDTVAPVLSVPADYTAECDEVLVDEGASAFDNCSGATITETRDTIAGDALSHSALCGYSRQWTTVTTKRC